MRRLSTTKSRVSLLAHLRGIGSLGAPVAVLLIGVIGGGCGGSVSEDTHTAKSSWQSAMPVGAEFARLRASFSPLRSVPDVLPGWLRRQVEDHYEKLDPTHAQHVGSSVRGRYWLIPGRDETCLFEARRRPLAVFTCTTASVALGHGFSIVSIRPLGKNGRGPYKRRIFGVVPDWVKRVRVRTKGNVAEPPVHRGFYSMSDWNFNPPDTIAMRPRPAAVVP